MRRPRAPRSLTPTLVLTALLTPALALSGCKEDIESKTVADPIDDPWVDAIEEEQPDGAALVAEAAPETEPNPEFGAADELAADEAEGAAAADESDTAGPEADAIDPATGVLASPEGDTSKMIPKHTGGSVAAGPFPTPADPGDVEPGSEDPAAPADATPSQAAPAVAPAPEPKPEPAGPPPLTLADLHGNYRYSGGDGQRKDLEAAIEDAILQLPGAFRGIGRRRLTNTNPIDTSLDITIAGDKVKTEFTSGFDANCEIDGPTITWVSNKGNKYKVRVRKKDTKLIQVIVGEDGTKTTVFVLSADRKRLTVHHKITSDRLKIPMTYKLSYSRK